MSALELVFAGALVVEFASVFAGAFDGDGGIVVLAAFATTGLSAVGTRWSGGWEFERVMVADPLTAADRCGDGDGGASTCAGVADGSTASANCFGSGG